jgi:hypothetical protein
MGPLRVTAASRSHLVAAFAVALALIAVLAAALVAVLRRRPPPS